MFFYWLSILCGILSLCAIQGKQTMAPWERTPVTQEACSLLQKINWRSFLDDRWHFFRNNQKSSCPLLKRLRQPQIKCVHTGDLFGFVANCRNRYAVVTRVSEISSIIITVELATWPIKQLYGKEFETASVLLPRFIKLNQHKMAALIYQTLLTLQ